MTIHEIKGYPNPSAAMSSHDHIIAFHFMYGIGRLQQRTTCFFNQFQIYDKIGVKGCAGGLNEYTI